MKFGLNGSPRAVPQFFADVDKEKVLKLGIRLNDVYGELQTLLGGSYV
jgi:HAE1 family hydrophobic/amphiphilic exporter-1